MMCSEPKHEIPLEVFFIDPQEEPDIHAVEDAQEEAAAYADPEDFASTYARDTASWD